MMKACLTWYIISTMVFHDLPWNPTNHYSWNMFPKFPIQICYASATKTSQIEYSDANEDLSERFIIRGDENIQKAQKVERRVRLDMDQPGKITTN